MCRQLDAFRKSIAEVAAGFDARTMLPSEAGAVMRVCAQIEASVSTIKALASARLAEGTAWQGEGCRSPAEHVAKVAGMSPSSAKRMLDTGRRLADQPEVAAAALAGELSSEKTAAVADGASANPGKARALIEKAKNSTLPELQEAVARAKAEVRDQEARRREIHANRSFRRWTDSDGAFHARLYGNPEDGVALWRMLDPIRRRLIVLRRQDSIKKESLDALDYDALMVLASAAVGADAELSAADLVDLGLFADLTRSRGAGRAGPPTAADGAGPVTAAGPSHRLDAGGPLPTAPPAPRPAPGRPDSAAPPASGPASGRPDSAAPPASGPASVRPDPTAPPAADAQSPLFADDPSAADPPVRPPDPPPPKKTGKKLGFSPAKVLVRVDYDTLLRGVVAEGELCEIVGYGPVPVSVIQELIENGQASVAAVLTRAKEVVGVYHFGRRPNAVQATALDFLYPWCAVNGCNARSGLQSDHREDWIKTKFTIFDLLDRLCPHHHRLKTHKGWALVEGTGRRDFVPPGDPRHPRFKQPAAANSRR